MSQTEIFSRNEKILHKLLGEDIEPDEPQSRIEKLLLQLIDVISDSGGTFDYVELINKPQINGVELTGSINSDELNVQTKPSVDGEKIIFS